MTDKQKYIAPESHLINFVSAFADVMVLRIRNSKALINCGTVIVNTTEHYQQ